LGVRYFTHGCFGAIIESLHMSPFFIVDVNDFGKLKYRSEHDNIYILVQGYKYQKMTVPFTEDIIQNPEFSGW
jgi:hypothetical protein